MSLTVKWGDNAWLRMCQPGLHFSVPVWVLGRHSPRLPLILVLAPGPWPSPHLRHPPIFAWAFRLTLHHGWYLGKREQLYGGQSRLWAGVEDERKFKMNVQV